MRRTWTCIAFLLLAAASLNAQDENYYYYRGVDSTYSVQLRGHSSDPNTSGLTLNMAWDSDLGVWKTQVARTGLYYRYEDPNGGATYSLDSKGTLVRIGTDLGPAAYLGRIADADNDGKIDLATAEDSSLTLQQMTTNAIAYLTQFDSTNRVGDDVTVKLTGSQYYVDTLGTWASSLRMVADTTALKAAQGAHGKHAYLTRISSSAPFQSGGFFTALDTNWAVDGYTVVDHPVAGMVWARTDLLENPGTYRMEWFGAVKNSSADSVVNRTAWDRVWNAIRDNGGGILKAAPNDTFHIDGATSYLDTAWSNTTIEGGVYDLNRIGGWLFSPPTYSTKNFIVRDAVVIMDDDTSTVGQSSAVFNFQGDSATAVGDTNIVFDNVTIRSINRQILFGNNSVSGYFIQDGLKIDGCTFGPTKRGPGLTAVVIGYTAKNVIIRGSTFLPALQAWEGQNPINCNTADITISDNRINIYHEPSGLGNTGILIELENAAFDDSLTIITGNTIDAEALRDSVGVSSFTTKGMQLSSLRKALVSDNVIRGLRTSNDQRNIGISLGNEDGQMADVTIRDNSIMDFVVGIAINTSNTVTATPPLGRITIRDNEIYDADSTGIGVNLVYTGTDMTTQFDSLSAVIVQGNNLHSSGPIAIQTDQTSANPWRTHLIVRGNAQYDTSGVFVQLVGTKYWYVTLENNNPGPLGQAYTYQTFVDAMDSLASTKYADVGPLVMARSRLFDVANATAEVDWFDFDAGFIPVRALVTVVDATTGDSCGWNLHYYSDDLASNSAIENFQATPASASAGTFQWYIADTLMAFATAEGTKRTNLQNGTYSKMRIQNLARSDANNTNGTGKFFVTVWAILNTKGSK